MPSEPQRIVIYTCITRGYDTLLEPLIVEPGIDYVCVSDRPVQAGSVWQHLPLPFNTARGAINNRYVKMHPHILFPDHDISVYVDGNIQIISAVTSYILAAMEHQSLALYQHPYRNCIYAEARECSLIGHDWQWRIATQMARYRQDGFPFNWGLFEGNVIIRDLHDPPTSRLMECWWNEYCKFVKRDQLSLTYLAWKMSVPIHNLGPSDPRGAHKIFSLKNIHADNSLLVRLRRTINRKFERFRWFKIPTDTQVE